MVNDVNDIFRLSESLTGVSIGLCRPPTSLGRTEGFAHRRAMPLPQSAHLPRIWPFLYSLRFDHRNKPLPIIPQPDVSCQVRHTSVLIPPSIRLSAYPITFPAPFAVSNSMRIAVRCTNIPLVRRRKRHEGKDPASTGNSTTFRPHS